MKSSIYVSNWTSAGEQIETRLGWRTAQRSKNERDREVSAQLCLVDHWAAAAAPAPPGSLEPPAAPPPPPVLFCSANNCFSRILNIRIRMRSSLCQSQASMYLAASRNWRSCSDKPLLPSISDEDKPFPFAFFEFFSRARSLEKTRARFLVRAANDHLCLLTVDCHASWSNGRCPKASNLQRKGKRKRQVIYPCADTHRSDAMRSIGIYICTCAYPSSRVFLSLSLCFVMKSLNENGREKKTRGSSAIFYWLFFCLYFLSLYRS